MPFYAHKDEVMVNGSVVPARHYNIGPVLKPYVLMFTNYKVNPPTAGVVWWEEDLQVVNPSKSAYRHFGVHGG